MEPQDPQELLDRFPYMQELCRRIDDINNAINHGNDGLEQAYNLLTDLPMDWLADISQPLQEQEKQHNILEKRYRRINSNQQRNQAIKDSRKQMARSIKSAVVGVLNKKGILLSTRQKVENNLLSQLDFEDEQ